MCLVLDTIKTLLNLVFMQAEHTRAKRARKSPVFSSADMYSSEGKRHKSILYSLPQWLRTYYNTSSTW